MQTINTNFAGLVAQRNLTKNTASLTTSIERLSSGLRINSAKDDAAGLAIAEKMNSQIRGQEVAKRNANDGISFLQVADGALSTVSDNLQRMRDLAVQSSNGTISSGDRDNLDNEFQELGKEIERVMKGTKYNDVSTFGASGTSKITIQIGANKDDTDKTQSLSFETKDAAGLAVGLTTIGSIAGADASSAQTSLEKIDAAIKNVTKERSNYGAQINRLDSAISNLDTNTTNLSTARGRIVDADFAKESAALTRTQILQQAGSAMLSQANQLPQGVLSLLPR
ncbi:MAG: flagellin FliC [Burkholderiales bacterium]|jgi:flagellin|nr:flagellin FliC [Burkholderiales bacterium]